VIGNDSGVEGAPWGAPEQHDATCHDMSCLMNFYDFLQVLFFFLSRHAMSRLTRDAKLKAGILFNEF